MFRRIICSAVLASCCLAQPVSLGIDAGIRTTSDVSGDAQGESKRYVAGPSLNVALGRGFSVTTGVLYQRFGYRTGNGSISGSFVSSARANVWEVPLLAERRFAKGATGSPFVFAGYSPRWIHGSQHTEGYNINLGTGARSSYSFDDKWRPAASHGVVVGGGLEFQRGRIRILPQIRYTRWNRDVIDIQGSHGYHLEAQRNEVRAMLGLRFP